MLAQYKMVSLGKRKVESSSVSESDANDIFRRYFESRFEPLADTDKNVTPSDESEDDEAQDGEHSDDSNELEDEDESDWGGFSENDGEDDEAEDSDAEEEGTSNPLNAPSLKTPTDQMPESAPIIEVVDHSSSSTPKFSTMSKKELKAFMVRATVQTP